MSGIKRFELDFSAVSPKSQAQSGSINVFQRDNEVYVKAGEGSTHILADRHCTPCSSAFEELQKLAAEKRDGGLYAMAVEQTERRKKAMEQAALDTCLQMNLVTFCMTDLAFYRWQILALILMAHNSLSLMFLPLGLMENIVCLEAL